MKPFPSIKCSLLALLISVICFTGCKKEKNENPPADTYDLIGSGVVGIAGGTISTDDVFIEIPAGALNSEASLELYLSSAENPYGEEGNSLVYWLKGLPDQLNAPVKLSLRYQGTLSEESYICLGKPVIATSGQDTTWSESFFPATDSSGFLQAVITPDPGKMLKSAQYQGRYGLPFFSINNYWYYQTDHFLIHFPGRYQSTGAVEALAAGLEGAYDTLKNMGFTYNSRTSWPVEVTVCPLDPEIDGQTDRSFPYSANSGYIEINTAIMTDKPLLTITGAHEFFHVVQDFYNSDEQYNWLQEASAVWFEEKFAANPATYASDARKGHELEPFSGLQAGATGTGTHHGYGCSAVLKYAVSQYGNGIIKNIWEECRNGEHPVEAVKLSTDPFVIWFINFMREYTLGNVYSDMGVSQFVYNDKFTINSDQDVQKSFEKAYPDLSGEVYIVEPKSANFKDESKLQLDLTGTGGSMYVLKKTGSSVTSIGYDVSRLVIPDLKGLQSSGSTLYVLVINYLDTPPDYTATTNVRLDMTVINTGHQYVNYFASKTDTISVCMTTDEPYFLMDVNCTLTSQANDFRVAKDSTWFKDEYKWLELYYPVPQGSDVKTLHVHLNLQNLRKNPVGNVTWDPYISQVLIYISDKNGQNTLYMDGSGNYEFDIVYDLAGSWPFANITMITKDVLNQGYECSSTVFTIGLFSE